METDQSVEEKLAAIRERILKQQKLKNTQNSKPRNGYYSNNRTGNSYHKSSPTSNHYQKRRNKDDRAFSRTVTVHIIETEEATDAAVEKLNDANFVGFDCEGIVTMGRTGKVSLIQVCDHFTVYLFDIYGMNSKIPDSLHQWLSSDRCVKFVHDSRQDQDALYHCHGVTLGGVFDTTIANLVYRVWFAKARANRLTGMDALSHSLIHNAEDYKVNLRIKRTQTAASVSVSDLRAEFRERMKEKKTRAREKRKRTNGDGDAIAECEEDESESEADTEQKDEPEMNGNGGEEEKEKEKEEGQSEDAKEEIAEPWKTYKVNIFDLKQNTKLMMSADMYLWAKRPIPINLVIYAAIDGYVSLLMGQYYLRKFKQFMIDKTLFVSARWCRMVAREIRIKASSAKVPPSIVKLIRSNTQHMDLKELPPIDEKFKYLRERQEMEQKQREQDGEVIAIATDTDTVDMEFDDLLLLTSAGDFVARQLDKKLNPNQNYHEKHLYNKMSDVYKLKYDPKSHVVSVGKLNYHRLIPLKLLQQEIDNFAI